MLTCVIILHSPNWPIRSCHVTIFQNETLTLIFIISFHHHGSRGWRHREFLRPPHFTHSPSSSSRLQPSSLQRTTTIFHLRAYSRTCTRFVIILQQQQQQRNQPWKPLTTGLQQKHCEPPSLRRTTIRHPHIHVAAPRRTINARTNQIHNHHLLRAAVSENGPTQQRKPSHQAWQATTAAPSATATPVQNSTCNSTSILHQIHAATPEQPPLQQPQASMKPFPSQSVRETLVLERESALACVILSLQIQSQIWSNS